MYDNSYIRTQKNTYSTYPLIIRLIFGSKRDIWQAFYKQQNLVAKMKSHTKPHYFKKIKNRAALVQVQAEKCRAPPTGFFPLLPVISPEAVQQKLEKSPLQIFWTSYGGRSGILGGGTLPVSPHT